MRKPRRIYITHCCAKKDPGLRGAARQVLPDELYTAAPTQRFMKRCRDIKVNWAIFSDKFGVWFPHVRHEWYEKDPKKVTETEFKILLADFDRQLRAYDELMFYRNPGRFHFLYHRLIQEAQLRERVILFSHLSEIV